MEEQKISIETAKLAKEKGLQIGCKKSYCEYHSSYEYDGDKTHPESYEKGDVKLEDFFTVNNYENLDLSNEHFTIYEAPTQSLLQKFIRETRGVHIEIHRNASGYYWSMCKADGGTDLGWSDHTGPNLGGVWDSYEGALENALQVQLSYDLPNDTKVIKHWGNYAEFAKHLPT